MNEKESKSKFPESLSEVLGNNNLRARFMNFLQSRLAEECLLFYESVERFEALTNDEKRLQMGKDIITNFVFEDSLYWINVSGLTRKNLLETEEFQVDTFKFAKTEIVKLMSSNFFHDFIQVLRGDLQISIRKRRNSIDVLYNLLSKINVNGEDEAIPEEVEARKKYLSDKLKNASRTLEKGLTMSRLLRKKATSKSRRKSSGASSGSEGTTDRFYKRKRTKNAFRRFFKGKTAQREMSFWDGVRLEVETKVTRGPVEMLPNTLVSATRGALVT